MKTVIYLFLYLLMFVSCQQQTQLDADSLKVLVQTVSTLKESNVVLLYNTEDMIRQLGDRQLDLDLLEKIRNAVSLRKEYGLALELSAATLPINVKGNSLKSFATVFNTRYEQVLDHIADHGSSDVLNRLAQQYQQDRSLLNLILFDLHLVKMERDILSALHAWIGGSESFGFDGRIYIYPQTSVAEHGQPFTMLVSLGQDFIGNSVTLTSPEITINNANDIDYKLTSFEKGLWQLTFTPENTGTHIVDFTTYFIPKMYPEERYAFKGKFEVMTP